MAFVQLDPQIMPGADAFDSSPGDPEEEERLRRELGADIVDVLGPGAAPEAPSDADAVARGAAAAARRPEAEEAARVGAEYRASGGQPAPSAERVAPQRGHAGTQRILTFDPEVRTQPSPSAPRVPPSQPSGSAAPSSLAALPDRLRAVLARAQQRSAAPAPQQPPAAPPVDRARLLEMARAKAGGGRQPADHTGADVADAVRRPLHAIGAGLVAAAGRSPSRFRSLGDESRERERAAQQIDARGAQQASAARLAEMRLQQQGEEAAANREFRGQQLDSLDRYRTGQLESRREADAALTGQRRAQEDRVRALMQRERDLDSLDSQLTQDARQAYRDRLRLVPEHLRGQFPEDLADNLPARQIDRLHDQLSRYGIRDTRHARGGSGGGGARRQEAREALQRRARAARLTDDQIASYGNDANALRREVERRERAAGGGGDSDESPIPGLRIGPSDTHRRAAGSVIGSVTDVRALRDEVVDYRNTQRLLNDFERLLGEASVAERAGNLIGTSPVMRQLENTQRTLALQGRGILGPGAITDQERALLMQLVPSIDLVRSSATARQQLADMRRSREARFTDYLDTRGFVLDEGYRVGGGGQRAQQQSDTVSVTRPDGTRGTIPRRLIQQARDRGWTVNDG